MPVEAGWHRAEQPQAAMPLTRSRLPQACRVLQQALASAHGEIPATPGIQHIEEVAQRTTEIKEGMEVELTSRVSCAGQQSLQFLCRLHSRSPGCMLQVPSMGTLTSDAAEVSGR